MQEDVTAGAQAKVNSDIVTNAGLIEGPTIQHPLVVVVLVAIEDRPQIGGLNGLETKASLHANGQPSCGVDPLADVPALAVEPVFRREAMDNDEIPDLVQVACGGQEGALLVVELAHPSVGSRSSP